MFRLVILLACLVYSSISLAAQPLIRIATGLPKPPFILDDGETGIQLDIIKQAMQLQGYRVAFVSMPLNRTLSSMQRYGVDGIATLPADYDYPGVHLSEPYIEYQNVVVTLANRQFEINKISDLSGKSVAAFQNAHKFLGEEYHQASHYSLEYREVADQKEQIELLFDGKVDALVMDLNIFQYLVKLSERDIKTVKFHPVFIPNFYHAGFTSTTLANQFSQGVNQLLKTGQYQAIIESYVK